MRALLRVALAALVLAIVVGSLISSGAVTRFAPGISPGGDAFACIHSAGRLDGVGTGDRRPGILRALGLTLLIGGGLEFSQIFIPARTFSWFDLGMNVLGAAVGVASVAVFKTRSVCFRF